MFGVARRGALSSAFNDLPPEPYEQALAAVVELPENVGLLSLRELGPVMGRLRGDYELNVLSSEALAAAIVLEARVLLSAPSPRLEHALAREGLRVVRRTVT